MDRTLRISARAGYSIVELLIACVVGVLVLSSAMSLAVSTFRSLAGLQMRDGIDRNARYVGMVLQRDLTETGVLIDALPDFGTLAVWNDSISILRVAFDTSAFPQYNLSAGAGNNQGMNNAPAPGIPTYVDIATTVVPRLAVGDLARYQRNTTRRLILVSAIQRMNATTYRVSFTTATRLIHHQAGLAGGIAPAVGNLTSAFIQKLTPVMYWRTPATNQLWRAQALNMDGTWNGAVIADGVSAFDASLIFTDGDELTQAVPASGTILPLDADTTNNYNQISGIRVRATVRSETTDARVNGGAFITRNYEWFVAPRNLIYERNAI